MNINYRYIYFIYIILMMLIVKFGKNRVIIAIAVISLLSLISLALAPYEYECYCREPPYENQNTYPEDGTEKWMYTDPEDPSYYRIFADADRVTGVVKLEAYEIGNDFPQSMHGGSSTLTPLLETLLECREKEKEICLDAQQSSAYTDGS